MNLLPKSFQEFSSRQYWNTFFAKRGEQSFEWYGEYTELCGLIHKYVRAGDNILVAGCGNSTLSGDLYKVGYRNLTNVDNSEVVIRQMGDKYGSECPDMRWMKMDLARMTFVDETFTCVLDKATLDALMTDDSEEVVALVDEYFSEVSRVLRVGGRFVCVSLLQEHILQHILTWFPTQGWMVRVCRCEDAEKSQNESGSFHFPVFFIVCTKFKKMPNFKPVIEIQLGGEGGDGGGIQRVEDTAVVMDRVRELQQYALLRHTLHNKSLAGECTSVQLCDASSQAVRYTLHIVDSSSSSTRPLKFAVFIVPLGREREWLFGSAKGREQLSESAGVVRLVVVHLHHSASTLTLQHIQDELSPKIMELAPSRLTANAKIPFLSVGEEMGEVEEVTRGHSDLSGEYVVEDIHPPGAQPIRRLVFLGNQAVVQSEARIVATKPTHNKNKNKKKKKNNKPTTTTTTIDHSYLSCHHHLAMSSGVTLAPPAPPVLVIGLGGGALAAYIHSKFTQAVVAVELDAVMVDVATNYFHFKMDDRMKVEVCDGLHYIKTATEEGLKFGAILFDVDSKDSSLGLSCPPTAFVEPLFLQEVAKCLVEGGILIMNLVCRDEELKSRLISDLKAVFPSVLLQDIPEEVNCVLHCFKDPSKDPSTLKSTFVKKVQSFSETVGKFESSGGGGGDNNVDGLTEMLVNVCVL